MVSGMKMKGINVIPAFMMQYECTAPICVNQVQGIKNDTDMKNNPECKLLSSMYIYDSKTFLFYIHDHGVLLIYK